MAKFRVIKKLNDKFSTCFRQWRAAETHCSFLHGYGIEIELEWEGSLDDRNWLIDFGSFKRTKHAVYDNMAPDKWLAWLLDHTVIMAEDDPLLEQFFILSKKGAMQLRIVPHVGCERFAEYIFDMLSAWTTLETEGRAKLIRCEVKENGKNSASVVA